MEKDRVIEKRGFRRTVTGIAAMVLSLAGLGCRAVDLENPWERYYNAERYGTAEPNIYEHFNMHRGRWWNYYTRGACYLEHKHYAKAIEDFNTAIAMRGGVETRDARTYGMHFTDYFPLRERGIAIYFQGKSMTGNAPGEEQLEKAVVQFRRAETDLAKSLSHAESSRAKYYLNQTRKAIWETSSSDRTPPVVHVDDRIYTNGPAVRFGITVTDGQSGVEKIRIHAPEGGVVAGTSELSIEVAREEVSETVTLTLDSMEKEVDIQLTTSDLAGNWSRPHTVHIVPDTRAPVATVTVLGTLPLQNRLAVFVRATDDSALQEVQAGGDPNDRFSCYGQRQYECTVIGTPVGGALTIRVIDNAGNAVVANIPVEVRREPPSLPMLSWRPTRLVFPFGENAPAFEGRHHVLLFQFAELGKNSPHPPVTLYPGSDNRTVSLTSFEPLLSVGETTNQKQTQFYFPPHVCPPDGGDKVISQNVFIVEGTLRGAQGVTTIRTKVDGREIEPYEVQRVVARNDEDLVFAYSVDLEDRKMGKIEVVVQAFRGERSCTKPIKLTIVKERDCTRYPDSICQAVFMLSTGASPYRLTIWNNTIPEQVYGFAFLPLKDFVVDDPNLCGRIPLKRLGLHHVVEVYRGRSYADVRSKSVEAVAARCGRKYDLLIHGAVTEWRGGGDKALQITLKALDTSAAPPVDLQFASQAETADSDILAEAYIPGEASDQGLDATKWEELMYDLARKAMKKLPRVRAEVLDYVGTADLPVTINREGERSLCRRMGLCFYTCGDPYREATWSRNVYLKKIGDGWIADLDDDSYRVSSQRRLTGVENGLLVITK